MRKFLGMVFAVSLAVRAAAAEAEASGSNVVQEIYGGWIDCLVLRGGDCKAVVVPIIGGRVLNYSLNGENILFDPELKGRTLINSSNFWAGGYQLDVGPELRALPAHPWLFQGPWAWGVPARSSAVHVSSAPEETLGVQLDKTVVIDPDTGELGITQRMKNMVSNDVSLCLWDRTLCKGGGFAMFPLNSASRFKAGWSQRQGQWGAFRYDGDSPGDARVRIMDGVLVAQAKAGPGESELKVGADSEAGWIAYARGRVLFVKYFPVFAKGNYSDGGNSVEFYCSERVAELEPLSPEVALKPGESFSFPEKWLLMELNKEVTSYEQARALVKRIPRSPFAR